MNAIGDPDAHRVRYAVEPSVRWNLVDGEIVIFDLRREDYHILGGVAARIWQRVASGENGEALLASLGALYAVDGTVMAADVGAFLAQMCRLGLLVKERQL
jgi:hypothetical protein